MSNAASEWPGGRLLIATTNAGKVKEIRHELETAGLLGMFEVLGLKEWGGAYEDCVEDRPTFIGNAIKKARHFARLAGCLALADDSGLCVDALNGAPGVYSARYAGVSGHGADAANNAKLMDALKDVPDEKRQAQFVCAMALATPHADLAVMVDHVDGVLLREPRGENGFGYDPFFYFPQYKRTTAELDMQSKSRISHRGKALRRMIGWINENRTSLVRAISQLEILNAFPSTAELPQAVHYLKDKGYDRLDSIGMLARAYGIPHSEAKHAVHNSDAWSADRAAVEKLHEDLEKGLESGEENS